MVLAKLFELRDSATFIPIIAILVCPDQDVTDVNLAITEQEKFLLRRCGYPPLERNIIICNARGDERGAYCDPYDWNDRTYKTAHNYIIDNWDNLRDGQVIDVQYILGETTEVKRSESHD